MSVPSPEQWKHEDVTTSEARGCIFDTNAKSPSPKGRFDLVVYDDGLLAIHGNYLRTAILGASAGAGAGGPGIAATGVVAGTAGLHGYDLKRFATTASHGRDELLAGHPANHFLPVSEIAGLLLRRRWYEHSLQVVGGIATRTYRWKPKLNRIDYVVELLTSTFGVLFRLE
jgi:hypothetical protein